MHKCSVAYLVTRDAYDFVEMRVLPQMCGTTVTGSNNILMGHLCG